MKFENTEVFNFEGAFRGMRNPMNSWNKSDSGFYKLCEECEHSGTCTDNCFRTGDTFVLLGENDLSLAKKLIKAGGEHRKFMRQIFVSVDITAPLYWWKEFDTYKVGTVANSTSTMHKLTSQPITEECFEMDDFEERFTDVGRSNNAVLDILTFCEDLRIEYIRTKDKRYWKELVRWLPESWLQTRTITMNYENIFNMIKQRSYHKLNEWSGKDNPDLPNFISWARTLPYANELLFVSQEEDN